MTNQSDLGARARTRRMAAERRISELRLVRTRLAAREPVRETDAVRAARAANEARLRAVHARTSALVARHAAMEQTRRRYAQC